MDAEGNTPKQKRAKENSKSPLSMQTTPISTTPNSSKRNRTPKKLVDVMVSGSGHTPSLFSDDSDTGPVQVTDSRPKRKRVLFEINDNNHTTSDDHKEQLKDVFEMDNVSELFDDIDLGDFDDAEVGCVPLDHTHSIGPSLYNLPRLFVVKKVWRQQLLPSCNGW